MVRTTGLHSLLRSILRFTTTSHPDAVAARYGALWRLPRPDFHRLVICSFQGTRIICYRVHPGSVGYSEASAVARINLAVRSWEKESGIETSESSSCLGG